MTNRSTIILCVLSIFLIYRGFSIYNKISPSIDWADDSWNNNPYHIRNDLYTFIIKDFNDKSNIDIFKDPRSINILLNYLKAQTLFNKGYENKKLIEIDLQISTIRGCLYDFPDQEFQAYFSKVNSATIDNEGNLFKLLEKKVKTQKTVPNYKFGHHFNRSSHRHPQLCIKYDHKILSDEEFWTKDPMILGL